MYREGLFTKPVLYTYLGEMQKLKCTGPMKETSKEERPTWWAWAWQLEVAIDIKSINIIYLLSSDSILL